MVFGYLFILLNNKSEITFSIHGIYFSELILFLHLPFNINNKVQAQYKKI